MIRTIKTKQFKILAAVLAVVLTVSCVLWNTTKVHALEITDATTKGYNVVGGGTVADGKLTNASIGVYITGEGLDAKYLGNNIQWTHNGTNWASEGKVLHQGSSSTQKISAYYPYVQGYTSGGVNYNLTAIQTAESLKNDDLLYAAATDLTTAKTEINFNHLMSKLSLNLSAKGTELESGVTVKEVKISGLATTATFYPENGTLTADTDLNGTTVAYNNGTTYDALVFPTACNDITVTVTMSTDQVFTTTVSLENVKDQLASGTQYNITIQVGQDVVNIGDITANSWVQETVDEPLKTE